MEKLLLLMCVCVTSAYNYYNNLSPPPVRTSLGDSIDMATMQVLEAAYEVTKDTNLVSSPLGLMSLLALFNEGAGPATRSEINKFLGGSDSKQIANSFKNLTVMFSKMSADYLTVADKISVSNQYSLNDKFSSYARQYHCEFDALDFSKPVEAAAAINKWAAEKTDGHISDPVSPDMLVPETTIALYNIIYFKGHWHVPFKANETKEKDFHVSPNVVVKKPMMHLLRPLHYTESKDLDARMIELPYKEHGFSMVVVLPNQIDGLPSVVKKASEKGLLSDVFRLEPTRRDVDFYMPRFDIKTKLNFNAILPKVGVSKLFQEGAPGIVSGKPIVVSQVFQDAFIQVDEEGATAGAFTGAPFVALSMNINERNLKFIVDHPFLYAILHEDKILFAGTYSG